jgi:hypothetical protein
MAEETQRLPHVDEHATIVAADRERTWEALLRVAAGFTAGPGVTRFARLVGCADVVDSGPRPLEVGSAFPGFHVAVAEPRSELALAGSHHFSDYALVFRLDGLDGGNTRVRAETRAEFPHLRGAVYRTVVIGGRIHVLVTRRVLGAVKRNAERA